MSATKDIGSNIRDQRKKRGMTQRQLAEQLFVSASTVSKWEMKEAIPDIHMVMQLADIFQISVSELLGTEKKASEECADETLEGCVDKTSEKEALAVAEANVIAEELAELAEKRLCKYLKMLIPIVIIAILGCIAFSFIRSTIFSCRIVDEFYDDTSNHWGYNPIYHIAVEYNGVYSAEAGMEYTMEIREDYEQWFEKVEVILITYFEEYTDRNAVLETEFQSFLLPLSATQLTYSEQDYQGQQDDCIFADIVYNGVVRPSSTMEWEELIGNAMYSGTLSLSSFSVKDEKTVAVYTGKLYRK